MTPIVGWVVQKRLFAIRVVDLPAIWLQFEKRRHRHSKIAPAFLCKEGGQAAVLFYFLTI